MAPKPEAVRALNDNHIRAWCNKSPEGVAASYTKDAVFSINRADPMVGHQTGTRIYAEFQGWEEWELTDDCKVKSSFGWYDAEDYERQLAAGV